MTEISGVLQVGEASATARVVQQRTGPSGLAMFLVLVGLIVVCVLAGYGVARIFLRSQDELLNDVLGVGGGLSVALTLYAPVLRRFARWRYRATLAGKNISLELPIRIELTDEHLVYEIGDTISYARWRCVTEVFRSHGYWIFMAQGSTMFAPIRLFPNPAEERRFLSQALSLMSAEARQRSAAAVAASAWE